MNIIKALFTKRRPQPFLTEELANATHIFTGEPLYVPETIKIKVRFADRAKRVKVEVF